MNVLLLTLDDMNYNSYEFLREHPEGLTPNIDALREDALWLSQAHVPIAVCQPSRSALMTGRYPHHNGACGFEEIAPNVDTLSAILSRNGYYTGIIGKENHIAPKEAFCWDSYISTMTEEGGYGRVPEIYYRHTKQIIETAAANGQPFFLMANSHDPHRPFAGSADEITMFGKELLYSKVYSAEDVVVPGFLPDLQEIRMEVAQYLTSVHRADETVGEILRAVKEAGEFENTIIMLLSDNGMAFPFAKANCYLNSTKSPFILRWPGHIQKKETQALVSGIDYMPTILDMLKLPCPEGMDGTSMVHLFESGSYSHYEDIFTLFFKTANNPFTKQELHFPMRCVQDKQYAYIYNDWSDGETRYKSEGMSGLTYQAMEAAAVADEAVAERIRMYRLRVREELYDVVNDPNALHNLIDMPDMRGVVSHFRSRMYSYMKSTDDPLLQKFESVCEEHA